MNKSAITRFSAELSSPSSCASIIMSGDVDGYGVEQLLETAQRYARHVRVQLEGGEIDGALRLLERSFARLTRLGIEVTLARA
jgi:hypothetical protein